MVDATLRLLDLDERHSELLDRLSVLDQQVNAVLADWSRSGDTYGESDGQEEATIAFAEQKNAA
jgi:hypothetical protein